MTSKWVPFNELDGKQKLEVINQFCDAYDGSVSWYPNRRFLMRADGRLDGRCKTPEVIRGS